MARKILAIIAALIVATGVLFITLFLITAIAYPPSPAVNRTTELLHEYDASLPLSVYILLLLGYAFGAIAAGYVVTKMARRISEGISLPLIVGVLLVIFGIIHIFIYMPGLPGWVIAVALLFLIPMTLVGYKIGRNYGP